MFDQLVGDPSLPVPNPTVSRWQTPPHKDLLGLKSTSLPSQQDIVILGSGITACSISRELLQKGYQGSITILEAREVCSGATGRNGGRINCVAVLDYAKYSEIFGAKAAEQIVRFELAHYDELLSVAQGLGEEAFKKTEVRPVETVACVFHGEKLEEMKTTLASFEKAFPDLAGRWKVVEEEIVQKSYGVQYAKGALIGEAGAASAYRLVTEIFVRLVQDYSNLAIETNTPALSVSRDSTQAYPYSIETPRGMIRAKHVIHCTEGHTSHLIPDLRGILIPFRGQMTAQNPGQNFQDTHGKRSWSFYFQNDYDYLSQNELTSEIFVGGGDDLGGLETGLDTYGVASDAEENILAKSHLLGILPTIFGEKGWGPERPGKPLLSASWTGIMCNSLDHAPIVGALPQEALSSREAGDRENGSEWISAGYGGYGMVNAWRCGKALAAQVMGQEVLEWLPEVYKLTPERMLRLKERLSQIQGSQAHLEAFM